MCRLATSSNHELDRECAPWFWVFLKPLRQQFKVMFFWPKPQIWLLWVLSLDIHVVQIEGVMNIFGHWTRFPGCAFRDMCLWWRKGQRMVPETQLVNPLGLKSRPSDYHVSSRVHHRQWLLTDQELPVHSASRASLELGHYRHKNISVGVRHYSDSQRRGKPVIQSLHWVWHLIKFHSALERSGN